MKDLDPVETQEWLDALESVLDHEGEDRAQYLMTRMGELATRGGYQLPYAVTTPYRNTIPVGHEARLPGDPFIERRIRSMVRWNALAMVVRANKKDPDLGGHISSFASSATLYDVGFNHFFQAPTDEHGGDLKLQPAAPRRPGSRQQQDHPGTRRRVPRCALEREQSGLGAPLGCAVGQV